MSLSINTNVQSLASQRALKTQNSLQAQLMARLSAGTRIRGASDDAAGQAIAARMLAGEQGMGQATRNISDGSSMLQVAESAMANVVTALQRLRELAVASGNGSYTDTDRGALQTEAQEILRHIDLVGEQTMFNGSAVFSQDRASIGGDQRRRVVLDGLKTGWLSSAEDMVKRYYGIQGDGVSIKVNLDWTDGGSGVLASVSGIVSGGKYTNLHLNLDMADFGTAATPDGGGAPFYSDRIVAHEMAHAVMSRTMNFAALPTWFVEGSAELIHGADERVRSVIAGGTSVASIVGAVAGGGAVYEGGYIATRYLHDRMKALGVEGGIKGVMQYLAQNQSADLDAALAAVSGNVYADTDAFLADFGANGVNYVNTRMDLNNADTGAIGGLDADNLAARDARAVVPDSGTSGASDGLAHFQVEYPESGGSTATRLVQIQAGAASTDVIDLQFGAMNAGALGLADLDMQNGAIALLHVDQALEFVNKQRVLVGATSNRLDVAAGALQGNAINLAAARERVEGVDYASATAGLTRAQILQQAASAMLAQANSQPRAVLSLLR